MYKDKLYNHLKELKTEYCELVSKCNETNLTNNHREYATYATRMNTLADEIMKCSAELFQKYHIFK